jgi:cytidylate kinase
VSQDSSPLSEVPEIIAIDGPAGAGKTTTAREIARRLDFMHLDTGAMYRALALKVLRDGCPLDDAERIGQIAQDARVALLLGESGQRVILDGEDVTDLIRSPEVTQAVTPVCEVGQVRERMVELQRLAGSSGGVVVEGRDIGTVVFPDARIKIFLIADLSERARRRMLELQAAGNTATLDEVMTQIAERDRRDQQRDLAPLRQAADAILIDTTSLSFDQQVEEIIRLYTAR